METLVVLLLLEMNLGPYIFLNKHSTTELDHSPEKFWLVWFGDLGEEVSEIF